MPNEIDSAIIDDEANYNKKTKAVVSPKHNDTDLAERGIASAIAEIGDSSKIDISSINSFDQASQSRDQLYQLLDTMGDDPTVAAILETYAEDATEYNERGEIVWSESDDANTNKYVTYLLKSLKVDKNIYKWVYSLIKYGDIYWELFRESEYNKDEFFNINNDKETQEDLIKRKSLKEAIDINLYKQDDHFVHYIEMVPNPATTFELTKFGKTAGFIQTDIGTIAKNRNNLINTSYSYKFQKDDINIYNGDKFVHAALEDNSSRIPEKVKLFRDNDALNKDSGSEYTVKRGQSLLYNVFKIWRELSLLENSMLLNRITKSSITRVINVEIGDMPKEDVRGYLAGIKQLIEQKSAIDAGNSMSDYTNPGPIENNIYVPTHNGQGSITANQIGGDVNVGQLPDIDYFTNKYYGALRVPKQYFGFTDDGAGFSGGQSLAIISSRYAKAIKRIQNTILQGLTDVINLYLIDKGLESYLGKFTLKMQAPTTQEEIDRRENTIGRIGVVRDTMDLLTDIDDPTIKLKILKILLSSVISDSEITGLLEEQINKLGEEQKSLGTDASTDLGSSIESGSSSADENEMGETAPLNLDAELGLETDLTSEEPEETDDILPTPEEAGDGEDFTDNNLEF